MLGPPKRGEVDIGNVDIDDVPFIATSLAFDNCPIWSDDKHFKGQDRIKIYSRDNFRFIRLKKIFLYLVLL